MDYINSEMETDQLFAETETLYDFFELEDEWEASRQPNDHPFRRFLHRITDEDPNIRRSKDHQ